MPECQKCEKQYPVLTELRFPDGECYMVCDDCVDAYEIYADMEYERQKEEGLI
jgi:hypothetical protein